MQTLCSAGTRPRHKDALSCVRARAGTPYWLVKNEWSAHWGDEGYIKIDRAHDCAVSTQAFYVEMR